MGVYYVSTGEHSVDLNSVRPYDMVSKKYMEGISNNLSYL